MSFVCVFLFLVCFVVVNAQAEGGLTPHRELATGALCLGSTEFDDLLGRIEALAPTGSFPEGECENGHIGCGENQYQVSESDCPGDASKKCSKCAACPEGTTKAAGCTMDGKEACLPPPPLSAGDLVDITVVTNWFWRQEVEIYTNICTWLVEGWTQECISAADGTARPLEPRTSRWTAPVHISHVPEIDVNLMKVVVSAAAPGKHFNFFRIVNTYTDEIIFREFTVMADCTIDFQVNDVDMTYEEVQSGTMRHPSNYGVDTSRPDLSDVTHDSMTLNDYTMLIPDALHFRVSITIDDPRCRK
jgi:hypothetical protein